VNKVARNPHNRQEPRCYKLCYVPPRMTAETRTRLDPAGAGGVLLLGLAVCIGIGALVGWAAGSVGIGILIGAVIGIPGGIVLVYRRYRGAL
jgi:hypothetical protein